MVELDEEVDHDVVELEKGKSTRLEEKLVAASSAGHDAEGRLLGRLHR